MAPPQPQINTFLKPKNEQNLIDTISKVFMISQNIVGLNRAAALTFMKPKLLALAFIYAITINTVVLYLIIQKPEEDILTEVMLSIKVLQHLINCVLSFIFGRRMLQFFELIGKFDRETHIVPRVSRDQMVMLAQVIGLSTYITSLFIFKHRLMYLTPHLNHYLETHFYGHLISLLFQRLRSINNFIEKPVAGSAVLSKVVEKRQKLTKGVKNPMSKLMNYYQIIISAFEVLSDAIKWQFVAIVTTSFFCLLGQSLKTAITIKAKEKIFWDVLPWISVPVIDLFSILVPCVCCDMLRAQVRRLRELVASKLFENKLDKFGRSNARALLALTETSNLSFSLLRVVNVSISLPFTLVGLVITYLIIFLQFQKVIFLTTTVKV